MVLQIILSLFLSVLAANPLYDKIKTELNGKGDEISCKITDKGDRTFNLECFIPADADWKYVPTVFSNYEKYPSWILNHINEALNKKSFMFELKNIEFFKPNLFDLSYGTHFIFFKTSGKKRFSLENLNTKEEVHLKLKAEEKADTLIEKTDGDFYIFPVKNAEDRIYAYFNGDVKIRSSLLYRLFPTKLIENQLKVRVQRIIMNYQEEEAKLAKK
jgi:hypothetical protein